MNADGPRSAVVGVAGNGRCSGIAVGANFVLTSDHCVNAVGTPVAILDAAGNQVVGRVCETNTQMRLTLLCCMPIQSAIATLATTLPLPGARVEIESRSPAHPPWRASSTIDTVNTDELTIASVASSGLPGAGDSGGPAFVDGALVGILQEVRGDVAAYTSIPPIVDWVRSGMQRHELACHEWVRKARG